MKESLQNPEGIVDIVLESRGTSSEKLTQNFQKRCNNLWKIFNISICIQSSYSCRAWAQQKFKEVLSKINFKICRYSHDTLLGINPYQYFEKVPHKYCRATNVLESSYAITSDIFSGELPEVKWILALQISSAFNACSFSGIPF